MLTWLLRLQLDQEAAISNTWNAVANQEAAVHDICNAADTLCDGTEIVGSPAPSRPVDNKPADAKVRTPTVDFSELKA